MKVDKEATGPAWVDCKERLPEAAGNYIVYDEFYGAIGEAEYYRGSWCFVGSRKDDCSVTHWMPFPSPPAKSEGAT